MTIVALLLAACIHAQPVGDLYCGQQNVQLSSEGRLQLARHWETRFGEGFDDGLGRWSIENYENKLSIGVAEEGQTGNCLQVGNAGETGDTAFEVASEAFAVPPGVEYRLRFVWRGNRSFSNLAGHQGHYMTQLEWRSAGGEVVSATPFVLGDTTKTWQQVSLSGIVPADAASASVRLGFDNPNIADKEYLAVDNMLFQIRSEPAAFEASGQMLSRPLRARDGATGFSWQADTPPGTALRFQISGAQDRDGSPVRWSRFVGPDGTPDSFFTVPGEIPEALQDRAWLRYQTTFETRNPQNTPALAGVMLAGVSDGPWAGQDDEPPVLSERSATRTGDASAPISFKLSDQTGLDRDSLVLSLDSADITSRLVWADGRYTYTPREPLTPLLIDRGFAQWRVTNHAGNLTIERAARRVPDAPTYYHITREAGEVDTAFSLLGPPAPVEPGAAYHLSYWSRHSQDLNGAMGGSGRFSGGVTWMDAAGAPVGNRAQVDFGVANPEWHEDSYDLTAPEGAVSAQIAFGFDHPNIADGAFVDLSEVDLAGPRPKRPDDRPNLHRLSLQVADFAGNTLSRDWYVLVREPRTRNVVTLREDGVTLVDGKPFFPIGLYAVWEKDFNDNSFDKAFADLKAAGFNMAHTYSSTRGPDFSEFYAAAARHGIKLYVSSGAGANCLDAETVLWDVSREEGQPALLAWYLADDTASHVGSLELRRLSEAVHDVDPAHITVQADGVGSPPISRYTDFVDSTDGFMPELYPIRDTSDRGVPKIIADMQTIRSDLEHAGAGPRAIWAIVQYFQGWGWYRYPTRDELRAMSYLSIIHGATGITWYTYGGWGENHGVTDSPEVWSNMCGLAGELSRLQEVLLEPTGPQPPTPEVTQGPARDALEYPSISALLKQHDGKWYLLAANSSNAQVEARFSCAAGKQISVTGEERQITGGQNGFGDVFAPYGVHVYVWE